MVIQHSSPREKQEMIDRYIEFNPQKPGIAEAWLKDYGISVWALVAYHQAANGDANRVASDYQVPLEAVKAALAYYRQHKAAIDARIADHDAAFV